MMLKHILSLMVLLFCVSMVHAGDWDVPPAKESFHIFLLMGQSNMVGSGNVLPGDSNPVPGVLLIAFGTTGSEGGFSWQPAAHPLHAPQEAAGFGLGLPFAVEYRKSHPAVTVGLIPLAVGGAELRSLSKGSNVYADALNKAAWASEKGVIKGVLWHQGESDTVRPDLSDTYAKRLDQFVCDLRVDLSQPGLPFVAGQLAADYGTAQEHSAPDRRQRINVVREALGGLPARLPRTACVSSEGLETKGDQVHFDRNACLELGRRYATAVERLLQPIGKGDAPDGHTPERALGKGVAAETAEPREARMAWWREARFGMFIHWGLYSVLGGEYKGQKVKSFGEGIMMEFKIPRADYAECAKDFSGVGFNADQYVKLAQDAGMKYIVFTAKHAEGFAMFRTKVSPFNIVDATPFKRDPLAELADACRRERMPLGFYYTQSKDTLNGGFGNDWDTREKSTDEYFATVAIPQIKELLSNYGEYPAIMWWDAPSGMTDQRATEIAGIARKLKPDVVMDDRLKNGFPGDFNATWAAPRLAATEDWELHGCMNFSSWGFIKNTGNCSAGPERFVEMLVSAASKGGNFILNITPDAEGRVPKAQLECLASIGQWMKVNGEAIYGTSATPFGAEFGSFDPSQKGQDGKPLFRVSRDWRCTAKPGRLYIHILKWPQSRTLDLPGLQSKIVKATLLAAPDETVGVTQTPAGVKLMLPGKTPDLLASVVRLEIEGQAAIVKHAP